ncbi:unnamed protein product [Polarella glacialis]|uniref:WWE domain-containing protein n=1 Tax=Polarella glacialis TaxID=89957 RepID=A0A813G8V5_POLGL|nr:unnamed protein product [Polarella glacialis]
MSVDFDAMTAVVNLHRTGAVLELERRTAGMGASIRADACRGRATWEWCASSSGNGAWAQYGRAESVILDAAFQNKRSEVSLTIGAAISTYRVDLELMVQVNSRTGYRRLVRRRIQP